MSARRPDPRLLLVNPEGMLHGSRASLSEHLAPGDVVIANDAATIPASLSGVHEPTGAVIEVRLAARRSLSFADLDEVTAVVFGAGDHRTRTEDRPLPPALATGDRLALGPLAATVLRTLHHPRLVALRFTGTPERIWAGITGHGRPVQYAHVVEPLALWDMWTPIAANPVAFEPPSASFALDWTMLTDLRDRGIAFAAITLAAGLSSTGDPDLDARLPLDEAYHIPVETVSAIERTWEADGRVIAVGTTVARALEHAARHGVLQSGPGLATGRIGPDTPLRVVDAILSGIHEPCSSHYDLLGAFAPQAVLHRMTDEVAAHRYRPHEFGDSVLLSRHHHLHEFASSRCEKGLSHAVTID